MWARLIHEWYHPLPLFRNVPLPVDGTYFMSGVSCDGTETDIMKCKNDGWNVTRDECKTSSGGFTVKCYRSGIYK